jgi:hypothetical protein
MNLSFEHRHPLRVALCREGFAQPAGQSSSQHQIAWSHPRPDCPRRCVNLIASRKDGGCISGDTRTGELRGNLEHGPVPHDGIRGTYEGQSYPKVRTSIAPGKTFSPSHRGLQASRLGKCLGDDCIQPRFQWYPFPLGTVMRNHTRRASDASEIDRALPAGTSAVVVVG